MEVIQLQVKRREKGTRGYVNELRQRGLLPGVLYGKGSPDMLISVGVKDLERILRTKGGSNAIIDLQVEGQTEKQTVMLRDIQRDPVGQTPNHADFQRINMNEVISTELPLHLVGPSAGEKAGGVVQHGLRTLSVEGLPAKLPPRMDIDISHLELHDKLSVRDITVPEGVEIISDLDQVIVSIVAPRAVVEAQPAEEKEVVEAKDTKATEVGKREASELEGD